MVRFGRIVRDIADLSVMAVEFLTGVILIIVTVAGSAAAAAVWKPDLDIYPGNDAPKRPAAKSTSRSVADRRLVKKMFLFCASLTVVWCTLWTFIFSYGLPAGGTAVMLEVTIIPPAVLVLLAALRLAVTGKRVVLGVRQAASE